MSYEPGIQSDKELEFTVFYIENIAQRLQVNAEQVYAALTKKSDILYSYIVPEYDILHTQSKDYIVDDILQMMRERGITLGMTAHPILLQKKYARGWWRPLLYEYQPSRKAEHAQAFLKDFSSWLHADGYQGYHKLPENIRVVGCWAHARRKFDEALQTLPKEKRQESLAAAGECYCTRLFQLE